jgi:hypothetical protein
MHCLRSNSLRSALVLLAALSLGLAACGKSEGSPSAAYPGEAGGKNQAGIGVNSFLWRASLDTLAFMPLSSVDPFGGVIITDWYANPDVANERFKMTVYILDRRLRADGVKVAVFRQVKSGSNWADAPSNPDTAVKLENAILTRARQLRVDTIE